MYPCGNCRATAVGPDGRCAACGTYQQSLAPQGPPPPAGPPGYPAPMPMAPGAGALGMPPGGVDLRRGLATAVQVMLGVLVVVLLVGMIARGGQYGLYSDALDGNLPSQDKAENADDFYRVAIVLQFLSMTPLMVLWAVWFRRLRLNAQVFAPGAHRFGSGWAAGAWFTPVVNLWFPKQIANDIWRASTPEGPGYAKRGLLNAWWTTWLVGMLVSGASMSMYTNAKNAAENGSVFEARGHVEDMKTALGLHIFSYLVLIAAAVLALLLVRQATELQARRAGLGPQGGPAPYGQVPGYAAPAPAGYAAPPVAGYGTPPMAPPPGGPYPPYGNS